MSNYERINWTTGTKIKEGYTIINGQEYQTVQPEYSGETPINVENLNHMDEGIEGAFNYIKEQKVLWSDVIYLNASQRADLSEAISSQKNGIILIWSLYSSGSAQNSNFKFTYIPKQLVAIGSGYGCFENMGGTEGISAYKYFYVTDTSIIGHANNVGSHTANGVTYNNSNIVLRYVIGV